MQPWSNARQVALLVLVLDTVAAVVVAAMAIYLQQGHFELADGGGAVLGSALCLFAAVHVASALVFRQHERWAHAVSLPGLVSVIQAAIVTVVAFALLSLLVFGQTVVQIPALIVAWAMLIVALGTVRLVGRSIYHMAGIPQLGSGIDAVPVVLVGAGSGAEIFIKSCQTTGHGGYRIVAALDDRRRREGLSIHGVPVVTSTAQLDRFARRCAEDGTPLQAVIVTKAPSGFDEGRLQDVVEWASQNECSVFQMPMVQAIERDPHGLLEVQPLRIDDLLGRSAASPPTPRLGDFIRGQTVLVTGGGGSIGSELCRQIVDLDPALLVIIDDCEDNLDAIVADMDRRAAKVEIVPKLLSVRDRSAIDAVFRKVRPSLVFHAAALKHVPLVERQPLAGLHTNAIGSKNVADAAKSAGVTAVVLVSTDKAVNPTNVMGASKRMAELYAQSLDREGATRFVTVRFGNVLGSSGSVVPLFEQQIRNGGPVTVTHPEMVRYFMTIPEASKLVLHAMVVALETDGQRGCIHVLNMGEPVRIVALARKMIMLRGFRPGIDIDVTYSGLRPGEKLYEELFRSDERQMETHHESVLVATPPQSGLDEIGQLMERLDDAIGRADVDAAIDAVRDAVPDAGLGLSPRRVTDEGGRHGARLVALDTGKRVGRLVIN